MSKAINMMCNRIMPSRGLMIRDIDIKLVRTSHTKLECINPFYMASIDAYHILQIRFGSSNYYRTIDVYFAQAIIPSYTRHNYEDF